MGETGTSNSASLHPLFAAHHSPFAYFNRSMRGGSQRRLRITPLRLPV